jgi:hypothetical protein
MQSKNTQQKSFGIFLKKKTQKLRHETLGKDNMNAYAFLPAARTKENIL